MKEEEIMDTMSEQPLSLIIHSFLKCTQQAEGIQIQVKRLSFNVLTKTTYFPQLDKIINHDWIDLDITNDNKQKSNKSPVPSAMWDQMTRLTFSGCRRIKLFIKTCRTMLLRSYPRSLQLSFFGVPVHNTPIFIFPMQIRS